MRNFILGFLLAIPTIATALPVIPGEPDGWGMDTRAAYGGGSDPVIYKVTNLNNTGAGSLRACIEASGPRICIFEVSGNIDWAGGNTVYIYNPYLTVAGSTAPSPGIQIINGRVGFATHDVVWSHTRIWANDNQAGAGAIFGGPSVNQNDPYDSDKIVFANNTVGMGYDQAFDPCWGTVQNVTFLRNIVAYGLHDSNHPYGDPHSTGGILGFKGLNCYVAETLWAHHYTGPNSAN